LGIETGRRVDIIQQKRWTNGNPKKKKKSYKDIRGKNGRKEKKRKRQKAEYTNVLTSARDIIYYVRSRIYKTKEQLSVLKIKKKSPYFTRARYHPTHMDAPPAIEYHFPASQTGPDP
jgi:hypothetical protein